MPHFAPPTGNTLTGINMKIRVLKDPGFDTYSVQKKVWWWPLWINKGWYTNREKAFKVAFDLFHPDVTLLT